MLRHYELYLVEVIKGHRRGFIPSLIRTGLRFLSWLYRIVVWIRNRAFDHGLLRQYYPPVPLISVGNIVSGGTGKTPTTLLLAQHFDKEFQVAILSRGYRSPIEKLPSPVIVCGGNGPLHPASFCGDEPYLLAHNLPKALVVVGRDRRKASAMAVAAGAQVILLDDGMQHRGLARDFEVVVMDGNDPFGQGNFLPAGFLRESVSALSRADLIILNHVHLEDHYNSIKEKVAHYSRAPVVATEIKATHLWDLKGREVEGLRGKRVGMFCGIAHPDYFRRTLEGMGAKIVAEHVTADHVAIERSDLQRFASECLEKEAEIMICTEKDKVRLPETLTTPVPICWLQIQLSLSHGENQWNAFLQEVRKKIL
jgi:tetraacyldisaccharide 4'-kinase